MSNEVHHDHQEAGDSDYNAVTSFPLSGEETGIVHLRLESEDGDGFATFNREQWEAMDAAVRQQMGWN